MTAPISRLEIDARIRTSILNMTEVSSALIVGSQSILNGDQFSDLDYFIFTSNIDDWDREYVIQLLAACDLEPQVVYWNGLTKFHSIVNAIGVDFSVLDRSREDDIRRWPTLFYSVDGILKDHDNVVRNNTLDRASSASSSIENTLDGALYHLSNVAIQLRRREFLNARCRMTGVVESLLCLVEERTLGRPNFREPSRRFESRAVDGGDLVHSLAFSASPSEMVKNCQSALNWIESRSESVALREVKLALIREIRHNLQEACSA